MAILATPITVQLPELPAQLVDGIRADLDRLVGRVDELTRIADKQDAHWLYAQDLYDYLTQAAEEITRLEPDDYDYDRAKLLVDIHATLTDPELRGPRLRDQQQTARVCMQAADDCAQLLEHLQQGTKPDPDRLRQVLTSYHNARSRHRLSLGQDQPAAPGQQNP